MQVMKQIVLLCLINHHAHAQASQIRFTISAVGFDLMIASTKAIKVTAPTSTFVAPQGALMYDIKYPQNKRTFKILRPISPQNKVSPGVHSVIGTIGPSEPITSVAQLGEGKDFPENFQAESLHNIKSSWPRPQAGPGLVPELQLPLMHAEPEEQEEAKEHVNPVAGAAEAEAPATPKVNAILALREETDGWLPQVRALIDSTIKEAKNSKQPVSRHISPQVQTPSAHALNDITAASGRLKKKRGGMTSSLIVHTRKLRPFDFGAAANLAASAAGLEDAAEGLLSAAHDAAGLANAFGGVLKVVETAWEIIKTLGESVLSIAQQIVDNELTPLFDGKVGISDLKAMKKGINVVIDVLEEIFALAKEFSKLSGILEKIDGMLNTAKTLAASVLGDGMDAALDAMEGVGDIISMIVSTAEGLNKLHPKLKGLLEGWQGTDSPIRFIGWNGLSIKTLLEKLGKNWGNCQTVKDNASEWITKAMNAMKDLKGKAR